MAQPTFPVADEFSVARITVSCHVHVLVFNMMLTSSHLTRTTYGLCRDSALSLPMSNPQGFTLPNIPLLRRAV
jgi:hypothetical protein